MKEGLHAGKHELFPQQLIVHTSRMFMINTSQPTSFNGDGAGRRSDLIYMNAGSSEVSMKQNIAKISEACHSFLSLLQETWGGPRREKFLFSIYPPGIIFSRSPSPLRVPSKELIRLKSPRCEFSSLQHISGGLSGSHAINCGGVLSIRMNNLRGMLIGIPVLAKGAETKCC